MTKLQFTLVKGYQVASGLANDPRFPNGTITEQIPYFKTLGLNLTGYFPATLNAKFNCRQVALNHPDYYFKNVKWHAHLPAENFKFFNCQLFAKNTAYNGLIYQPQPATKTEHFQPENQIEILAPYIEETHYGDILTIKSSNISLLY
jgi:hypothetical protein